MKITHFVVLLLICLCTAASAQSETELEMAIDMLREQGMDPEQLKQMENQLKQLQKLEQQQQQNKADASNEKKRRAEQAQQNQKLTLEKNVVPEAGLLNLGIGDENFSLDIRSCSTTTQDADGLQQLAQVVATGEFRGAASVITITKSHPTGNPKRLFEEMYVRLMTFQDDEKTLSVDDVLRKRERERLAWYAPAQKEILNGYPVDDDMSLDELNAQMQAQQDAMSALDEKSTNQEIKYAMARGPVSISGKDLSFRSKQLFPSNSGKVPDAFFDLEDAQIYAIARCR